MNALEAGRHVSDRFDMRQTICLLEFRIEILFLISHVHVRALVSKINSMVTTLGMHII